MKVSTYPKVFSVAIVIILLVQLAESGKISEKAKKYSNKETRCPEGKDGASCGKAPRQGALPSHTDKPTSSSELVIHNHNRRPAFAKRFEHAMKFAERMVVEFSRELFSFYGYDKQGWEIGVIELIVRTVAKDMLFIMQAMNF